MRISNLTRSLGFRSNSGLSLIEMLTAMMLTGFIAAATCDMMAALSLVSMKADYQLSSTIQSKRVMDLLGQQIRSAQNIEMPNPESQSLTLKIPILGDPLKGGLEGVPINVGSTGSYDTYTYQIIPDVNRPGTGEFLMQRTFKAGPRNATAKIAPIADGSTQIMIKGIIGPQYLGYGIDPIAQNYTPKVFTYLSTSPANNAAGETGKIQYPEIPSIVGAMPNTGVAIQLEIQPIENPKTKIRSTTFGLRSEFYSRSSSYAQ